MAKSELPRIAVFGAGPIGLEAALYARKLGYAVIVYERGRVGEFMQRWGHVRLFSSFSMNSTSIGRATILAEKPSHEFPGESDCITGRDHYRKYLEPLAGSALLKSSIVTEAYVLKAGRRGFLKDEAVGDPRRGQQPFRLLLRDKQGKERIEETDIILDCSGTYGQHRWLGDGGIPALGELAAETQISYLLDDIMGDRQGHYSGKNILVVGSGYSAATTICNLADLAKRAPDTWVYWAVRGTGTQPIRRFASDQLRERDRLAVRANTLATRTDDSVEFHAGTIIEAVESAGQDRGFKVTARKAGQPITWNVDRIVANIGYTPDTTLWRELQIHECYASLGPMKLAATLLDQPDVDCLKLTSKGPETLRTPEPNFYVLGAKSFGRNANFLMRIGFDQVRDVFKLITGKTGLDLYKDGK